MCIRDSYRSVGAATTSEVMVDSIITAVRPGGPGVSSNLVVSSRCALPPIGQGDGTFRVFPVGMPRQASRPPNAQEYATPGGRS